MSTPPTQEQLLNQLRQILEEARHQWWLGLTTAEQLNFANEQGIAIALMVTPGLP